LTGQHKHFVIAHVNSKGTGVAAFEILAPNDREVQKAFETLYPERTISVIGIKGVGG
jgi:hypothetical protein